MRKTTEDPRKIPRVHQRCRSFLPGWRKKDGPHRLEGGKINKGGQKFQIFPWTQWPLIGKIGTPTSKFFKQKLASKLLNPPTSSEHLLVIWSTMALYGPYHWICSFGWYKKSKNKLFLLEVDLFCALCELIWIYCGLVLLPECQSEFFTEWWCPEITLLSWT